MTEIVARPAQRRARSRPGRGDERARNGAEGTGVGVPPVLPGSVRARGLGRLHRRATERGSSRQPATRPAATAPGPTVRLRRPGCRRAAGCYPPRGGAGCRRSVRGSVTPRRRPTDSQPGRSRKAGRSSRSSAGRATSFPCRRGQADRRPGASAVSAARRSHYLRVASGAGRNPSSVGPPGPPPSPAVLAIGRPGAAPAATRRQERQAAGEAGHPHNRGFDLPFPPAATRRSNASPS